MFLNYATMTLNFEGLLKHDAVPPVYSYSLKSSVVSTLCHHHLFLHLGPHFPTEKLSNIISSIFSEANINWC